MGWTSRGTARTAWRVLVPVVCLVAGFGFAASARDSHGTDLRPPGTANLRDLVRAAEAQVRAADAELAGLQKQVSAATRSAGRATPRSPRRRRDQPRCARPGGLTAVTGPGLTVILDDAPDSAAPPASTRTSSSCTRATCRRWSTRCGPGGAEAMSIAGQRVIATSAVRCVGNTLLLNGEVYSPPVPGCGHRSGTDNGTQHSMHPRRAASSSRRPGTTGSATRSRPPRTLTCRRTPGRSGSCTRTQAGDERGEADGRHDRRRGAGPRPAEAPPKTWGDWVRFVLRGIGQLLDHGRRHRPAVRRLRGLRHQLLRRTRRSPRSRTRCDHAVAARRARTR